MVLWLLFYQLNLQGNFTGGNILGPGPLIAIDIVLLYIIIGPLVLFAIYVLFDSLDKENQNQFDQSRQCAGRETMSGIKTDKKDPALLSDEDVETLIN